MCNSNNNSNIFFHFWEYGIHIMNIIINTFIHPIHPIQQSQSVYSNNDNNDNDDDDDDINIYMYYNKIY